MSKYMALSDTCVIVAGQSPDSKYYNFEKVGIPFFQGKADFGELYPTARVYCSNPIRVAEKGDILLSVRAPVGATNIAPFRCCIGRGLTAIRPKDGLHAKYLLYFLRYFESQLSQRGTGTTFNAVTQKTVKSIQVPVLSLHMQEEIVRKIEELFSELDKAVEALETIQQQLVVYRQAVVTVAFPSMSKENTVRLDSISTISGGITKGRKLDANDLIKLPYLRVANVQNGYLDLSEIKTIELKASEKDKYLLQFGDVLYTEGGDRDKLGRGTIWQNEIPDCVHQNHIFKARLNQKCANPKYVAYWSMSTPARNYFYSRGKQSVNLASINKTILSALLLPLPSLEEQTKIVQTIEARFTVCDSIEQTVTIALQQAATLRQSILKQAFEGNLIV